MREKNAALDRLAKMTLQRKPGSRLGTPVRGSRPRSRALLPRIRPFTTNEVWNGSCSLSCTQHHETEISGRSSRCTMSTSLSYSESLQWLDDRGGMWAVRATAAAILVIVAIGSVRVTHVAQNLSTPAVHKALVDAVHDVRYQLANSAPRALDAQDGTR